MELKHIELARLSVSGLNMRGTRKACDIANSLPSVRARGVLVLEAVRDGEVMGHLLAKVAGDAVAAENAKTATKVQRTIIRDCLAGWHGRAKVEGWVPRWMAFPATAFTPRGGVRSADRSERVTVLLASEADSEGEAEQPCVLSQVMPFAA